MCLLLILIIGTAIGYDLRCPVQTEWRLRAYVSCFTEDEYVCLFNLLKKKYQEGCLGSDHSSKGSKLVFQPLFNLAECNTERYQPIVFTTHGNSDCIFLKSKCNEEGQTVYSNGSSINDIACGCDYSQGYAFVSKPKNSCFCIPSEEDCTCFRVKCKKLSADYQCITDGDMITNTKCQEIHPQISFNQHNRTDQNIYDYIKGYSNAKNVTYIINVLLAVCVVMAVLTVKHVKDSDYKERKLKSESESDDDYKTKKCILESITKGACGKQYFARVCFVGKNGVGKTSLRRRLLGHKKEDVTSTQSTDGIEIEKCNINIKDGTWSRCDNDYLTRLIHQVYTEKNVNIERTLAGNVVDQEPICSNTDEPKKDSLNDDTSIKCSECDDGVAINITSVVAFKDNIETVESDLNQKQPENFEFQNVSLKKIDRHDSESDYVTDENINKWTSTIIKSCLQQREREHDDMMALCLLWDFAGQKDFYATHQVFLSNSAVYLLVTDSLDFTTEDEPGIDYEDSAKSVSFWFDAIHCYWSTTKSYRLDPPIIIVCTNEDRFKEPFERHQRQKKFIDNLSKVLKNQDKRRHLRNIYFVSNTEDSDTVFEEIRKQILRQAMDMENWGKDYPLNWLLFQKVLEILRDSGVQISTTAKLSKIAKHSDIGITNDNELKQCLQYCHDNGTVIYFEEEKLQDHVILDPNWLADAFRCLVSDKCEAVIKLSDHWQQLTETGQLTDKLIYDLFKREPNLNFFENKTHILEVMKRFDIIVKLKNSSALYMPCMMQTCTFVEARNHFIDESQYFYRTSWFCLEFQFLPPAFFNHILAWYIKQYSVSVIFEKRPRNARKALYRQLGVFNTDSSGCEQLMICEGPNIIALKVWNSRKFGITYDGIRTDLCEFVNTLSKRYRLKIAYTQSFKCKDGDFTFNRKKMKDLLLTKDYYCLEHKTIHSSDDLVHPWYVGEELRLMREKEDKESDEDM